MHDIDLHPSIAIGARFTTARGWDFSWRRLCEGLQITWVEHGGSDWRAGGYRGTRRRGSVSFVAPGEIAVGTRVHGASDFFQIELDPARWSTSDVATQQFDHPEIAERVAVLARRVRRGEGALAVESSVEHVLDVARRDEARSRPSRQQVAARRMREALHTRYAEPISLTELTEAAGVSRFHGLRAFRTAYGVTPFEYLMHLRLERAAGALLRGARPIDAAIGAGFFDQAHFTRWFRRMFRATPGAFARAQGPHRAARARAGERGSDR